MLHPRLGAAWEGFVIKQLLLCDLGREGAREGSVMAASASALRCCCRTRQRSAAIVTAKAVCWRWMRAPKGNGEPSNCRKAWKARSARADSSDRAPENRRSWPCQSRRSSQVVKRIRGGAPCRSNGPTGWCSFWGSRHCRAYSRRMFRALRSPPVGVIGISWPLVLSSSTASGLAVRKVQPLPACLKSSLPWGRS